MLSLLASTFIGSTLALVGSAAVTTAPAAAPSTVLPSAQPEDGLVMRVYDLRDLQQYAMISGQESPHSQLLELVERIGETAEIDGWNELIDGVFAVWATADSHERMDELVGTVADLFADRLAVSLVCYAPSTEQRFEIGQRLKPVDIEDHLIEAARVQQSVFLGGPTKMSATNRVQYLSSWMPIVGNSAIAYQPNIQEESGGIETSVLIADHGDGLVRLQLRGSYRNLIPRTMKFEEGYASGLTIELIDAYELTLDANLLMRMGAPTVVAANDMRVVVMTVNPAERE